MALHPDPETNKLLGRAAERLAFDLARPAPVLHVFEHAGNPNTCTVVEDPISGRRHIIVGGMFFREMEHRLQATYNINLREKVDVQFHRETRSEIIYGPPVRSGFISGDLPDPNDDWMMRLVLSAY